MGKFSKYILKGLALIALLGLAGLHTAKADPACTAGTLATYISSYSGGCTFDGLIFSGFGAGATAFSASGSTSFSPGTPSTANLLITPIIGADGAGLEFTAVTSTGAPMAWTANGGGVLDAEVPFEVSCVSGTACITDLYLEMTGSATAAVNSGGQSNGDIVTESYCTGAPPPFPPSCGSQTTLSIIDTSTTVNNLIGLTATGILSVGKDMGAVEDINGAPEGTSTITDVINEFSTSTPPPPSTPEPSSLLMLGSGLLSLVGYGLRRRGIV